MTPDEYEQLAEETQAARVALILPDLYARAKRAREKARATRVISADLRAISEEWNAASDASPQTGLGLGQG